MDFLLDPNIAYLFLLGGVLLAMMSLATPGTGFFEVGALFCIALAGYAIYNLSFNWWALVLIALSIVPFIYALRRPKSELFLGLSIVLLVVGSVFIFPRAEGQSTVNPLVALIASGLVAGFLWLAVRKSLEAAHERPSHDLTGLVGQIGEAKTRVFEEGSVQVEGELWSARSETSIPAGSMVRVVGREGLILIVEKNG
ncbi:MAG TPA: NfeD family protein [Anaerolineales bacterium]|nr:NfeD family protein [Anaerolineales bacterium]